MTLAHYRPHGLLMRAPMQAHTYDWATRGIAAHIDAGRASGHVRPEIDALATAAWFGSWSSAA